VTSVTWTGILICKRNKCNVDWNINLKTLFSQKFKTHFDHFYSNQNIFSTKIQKYLLKIKGLIIKHHLNYLINYRLYHQFIVKVVVPSRIFH
jgi:hypothetical protein